MNPDLAGPDDADIGGSDRLWPGQLLPLSAEEGVEGLGHDVRGARATVGAGFGSAFAMTGALEEV